jgi:RND family efflux transporter MFP subunit
MTQQDNPPTNQNLPEDEMQQHTGVFEKLVYAIRQLLTVVILPLAILGGGVYYAKYLKDTGPKTERREKKHNAPLVEVQTLTPTDETIIVHAMGTVIPARQISLYPQVTGRIITMDDHLEPGGRFEMGQLMLKIDPADFELAVDQKQAEVAQVEADYRIEEGQQAISKREYELLGQDVSEQDRDLMLRKPQMQTMAAKLKIAKAQLQQSKLDLQRTQITAPFNALVMERNVNVGSHVTTGTNLTQLVGTDIYWVQVALPVDQLKWITIPTGDDTIGSDVRVYNEAAWGKGVYRAGKVVRMEGGLEEMGRMAQLIVAVDDPIAIKPQNSDTPALLLDSYVRVEIDGKTLHDVYKIPRTLVQHDDQIHIFKDNALDIRDIHIVHRGPESVLVQKGLQPDEQLITSDLSAPVQDMPLRTEASSRLARTEAEAQAQTPSPAKASEQ